MRTSASTIAAALVVALSAPAAGADPCSTPQEPQTPSVLCGETTVVGATAAGIPVELSRDVTLAGEVGPGAEVEVGVEEVPWAPFVGIALVPDTPGRSGPGFVAGRVPDAGGTIFHPTQGSACPCTLPAGGYRLYLLTDRQATVTLRLGGLTGSTTLHPTSPTTFVARQMTDRLDLGHNLVARVAGDGFDLAGPGFLLPLMRVEDVLGGDFGVCWRDGDPPNGYVPGCVNGVGEQYVGFWGPPFLTDRVFAEPAFVPAGRYSIQAWFETPVPPSAASLLGVWASFD